MFGQLPEKLGFTDEHKRVLRNLVIDEHSPGTILHDFRILLDIFRLDKQTLTASHQIPQKLLAEINQRLKHPIVLALKRPQQKSYRHIHGLYLLLRASGLTYVESSGKKPFLVVDEKAYEQWESLTPTERYGNLLETWLFRGHADIIGEYARPTWMMPNNLNEIIHFIARYDLQQGLQVNGDRDTVESLSFTPGRHNLGLLDLFGLIDVQSGTPQPGSGWHIERITLTSIGSALLTVLYSIFFSEPRNLFTFEDEDKPTVGVMQEILQPYLPEWKNNLILPEPPFRDGIHIFKVSLGFVWRRIAIDAKEPLDTLASVILNSMSFDQDHLYEFSYHNRFGALERIKHPYMDEPPLVSEVLIGDVPLNVGQTMTFLFDFGDNWEFNLLLENIEEDPGVGRVKILEVHGEPPEQYPNWSE